MGIIPGSNIDSYNENNEKVRLSTFNDKLVKKQVEDMESACCTSTTIANIAKCNNLSNTELNETATLDSPCSASKLQSSDISTSSNTNTTYELIENVKETNEKTRKN